jgi:hypothetical protein
LNDLIKPIVACLKQYSFYSIFWCLNTVVQIGFVGRIFLILLRLL